MQDVVGCWASDPEGHVALWAQTPVIEPLQARTLIERQLLRAQTVFWSVRAQTFILPESCLGRLGPHLLLGL